MKIKSTIIMFIFCFVNSNAQYNNITIPEALYGTTFNLNIHESIRQIRTGNQTVTGSINNETFWGPTLFINKGAAVNFNITNNLNESTTIHWHGMHLPAVMDGGPHQVIPSGTVWQPYWTMQNNASTYWFHPHLHETTEEQITKGVGGLMIVNDPIESALPLPRTYGTDDIPIILTSRNFNASNQFTVGRAYGDYMLTNGTLNGQITLPKQVVRLRILNAEIERGYNLGFSDNRTFYVITNDGGLLNTPVAVTRLPIHVGERYEILVNLTNDTVGSSIDLKAYNSGQSNSFPGGEPGTSGQFGSLLNNTTFNVLHINIGTVTANPITTIPTTLTTNTYLTAADATVNRSVSITGGQNGGAVPFTFDNTIFNIASINKTLTVNTTEKWTIANTPNAVFGHSFHIHDVQFKILTRSSGTVGAHESGWKDTFFISRNESVAFVARFADYSDSTHPFMYHCHFAQHEDDGMMGQFVVTGPLSVAENSSTTSFSLFPNPTNDKLFIKLKDTTTEIYYITITTMQGRVVMMLPQPQWQNGIDISNLESGVYVLQMMDKETKSTTSRKFIKN
ncbi:multicopper oxidase domain-containing protein [Flavobacterium chungnamense]|uniref:Multicopper oxidase domain-containing protein n=1 Tax=Flavobacterium chungnamense TaxID=706182 RepID=A0ABP7UYF4_9FLAO